MPSAGDTAPDFTATAVAGDVEEFTLSERLDEAPIVLAFFPSAFTPICNHQMDAFQLGLDTFRDAGATIYGVSVDSPFALNAYRDEYGLGFDLVSDMRRSAVEGYGLLTDAPDYDLYSVANRAVFVIDGDGEIVYAWTADVPENEPDYEELLAAIEAV